MTTPLSNCCNAPAIFNGGGNKGSRQYRCIACSNMCDVKIPPTAEKDEDISLCPSCNSMTHTINGKCGKCGAIKSTPPPEESWVERFDKDFPCIQCSGDGHAPIQISETEWEDAQCEFHGRFLDPLKSFILTLLDSEREKAIEETKVKVAANYEKELDEMYDKGYKEGAAAKARSEKECEGCWQVVIGTEKTCPIHDVDSIEEIRSQARTDLIAELVGKVGEMKLPEKVIEDCENCGEEGWGKCWFGKGKETGDAWGDRNYPTGSVVFCKDCFKKIGGIGRDWQGEEIWKQTSEREEHSEVRINCITIYPNKKHNAAVDRAKEIIESYK